MMIRYDDMMIVQHTNSANLSIKCCNIGVLLLQVTGTTHNVVATCDQHNKRGDASVRLVGTNRRMEFELIVAVFGDGDIVAVTETSQLAIVLNFDRSTVKHTRQNV